MGLRAHAPWDETRLTTPAPRTGAAWLTPLHPKCFMHALPGQIQLFWQHARFGYCGHEVCIPGPAREGMQVEVAGDSGSCGTAQVQSEIEAVGGIELL